MALAKRRQYLVHHASSALSGFREIYVDVTVFVFNGPQRPVLNDFSTHRLSLIPCLGAAYVNEIGPPGAPLPRMRIFCFRGAYAGQGWRRSGLRRRKLSALQLTATNPLRKLTLRALQIAFFAKISVIHIAVTHLTSPSA